MAILKWQTSKLKIEREEQIRGCLAHHCTTTDAAIVADSRRHDRYCECMGCARLNISYFIAFLVAQVDIKEGQNVIETNKSEYLQQWWLCIRPPRAQRTPNTAQVICRITCIARTECSGDREGAKKANRR